MNNRKHNASNPNQGKFKKVLCVCSAGLLRSPTAALVLSQEPYNFNTRAVGLEEDFALIPIDDVHIEWADEIVCMTSYQAVELKWKTKKPIICLNIPDNFSYRDPQLMEMIAANFDAATDFKYRGLPKPKLPKKGAVKRIGKLFSDRKRKALA